MSEEHTPNFGSPESNPEQEKTLKDDVLHELNYGPDRSIADELARSPKNTWFACARTQLIPLGMYLQMMHDEGNLSEDDFKPLSQEIKEIQDKVEEISVQYPIGTGMPPESLQKEVTDKMRAVYQQMVEKYKEN